MVDKLRVLQVLPRVPPAVCGVGDHAWSLARCLQANHAANSSFVAAGISRVSSGLASDFPVYELQSMTSAALYDFLAVSQESFDSVILHMSVYGYHKRGIPLWLASGWKRSSRQKVRPRFVTMFHELAASGPLASSAFWLRPLQKWIIRQVACSSDVICTNRELYAEELKRLTGASGKNIVTMPVHSNFGEPEVLPLWRDRDPAMVMFAWGISSGESLPQVIAKAADFCRRFNLQKLHLIGGKNAPEVKLKDVELMRYGDMDTEDISRLLLSCRIAYTAYNPEYFGKSSLMAAFAAHGLVVICQGQSPKLSDGLEHGVHLLNEDLIAGRPDVLSLPFDVMARTLRGWYDGHSLTKNAACYAALMQAGRVLP